MKFQTDNQPQTYEVSGTELRINFNVQQVEREMINGNKVKFFEGDQVLVNKGSKKSEIIEAIIASRYTIGTEVALSRRNEADPAKVEYLAFVDQAKALAKGYFTKDGDVA